MATAPKTVVGHGQVEDQALAARCVLEVAADHNGLYRVEFVIPITQRDLFTQPVPKNVPHTARFKIVPFQEQVTRPGLEPARLKFDLNNRAGQI